MPAFKADMKNGHPQPSKWKTDKQQPVLGAQPGPSPWVCSVRKPFGFQGCWKAPVMISTVLLTYNNPIIQKTNS